MNEMQAIVEAQKALTFGNPGEAEMILATFLSSTRNGKSTGPILWLAAKQDVSADFKLSGGRTHDIARVYSSRAGAKAFLNQDISQGKQAFVYITKAYWQHLSKPAMDGFRSGGRMYIDKEFDNA